jgi:hypothetical protein
MFLEIVSYFSATSNFETFLENIYCVITGKRHLTLSPSTDLTFFYRAAYKTAQFNPDLQIEMPIGFQMRPIFRP